MKKIDFTLIAAVLLFVAATTGMADLKYYYNLDSSNMVNSADSPGPGTLSNVPQAGDWLDSKPGFGTAFKSDSGHRPYYDGSSGSTLDYSEISVSVLMRMESVSSWKDIWSIGNASSGLKMEMNGSGGFSLFTYGSGVVTNFSGVSTPTNLADNDWHFITWTASQSGNESKLYIDGSEEDSATWNVAGTIEKFQFASRLGYAVRAINTDMDEIRIYDHAISQSEVNAIIPEPATFGLLGIFGLLYLLRRRLNR